MTPRNIILPDDPKFYPLRVAAIYGKPGAALDPDQPIVDLATPFGITLTLRSQNAGRLVRCFFDVGDTISDPGTRIARYQLDDTPDPRPEKVPEILPLAQTSNAAAYPLRIKLVAVRPGDDFEAGQILWEYENRDGEERLAKAPYAGKILAINISAGDIYETPGQIAAEFIHFIDRIDPVQPKQTAPDEPSKPMTERFMLDLDPTVYPIRIKEVHVQPGVSFATGERLWLYEDRKGNHYWCAARCPGKALQTHIAPGDILMEPGNAGMDFLRLDEEPTPKTQQDFQKSDQSPPSKEAARHKAQAGTQKASGQTTAFKSGDPSNLQTETFKTARPAAGASAFDRMPDGKFVIVARYEKRFLAGLFVFTGLIIGGAFLGETRYSDFTDSFRFLTDPIKFSSPGSSETQNQDTLPAKDTVTKVDSNRTKNDLQKVLSAGSARSGTPTASQQTAVTAWIDG